MLLGVLLGWCVAACLGLRPTYHYTRPTGWMNDPVPFQQRFDNGTTVFHLFHLCDPNSTIAPWNPGGHTAWCHASSTDGATSWTTHKPALMAGPWPGGHGVSGTGNVVALPPNSAARSTLNATTAIFAAGPVLWLPSDDGLLDWTNAGSLNLPPVPPALNMTITGDTHVFMLPNGTWRLLLAGATPQALPATVLYASPDLSPGSWVFVSVLYVAPSGDPRMECPSLSITGATTVLVWSVPSMGRSLWATGPTGGAVFSPTQHGIMAAGGYADETTAFADTTIAVSWLNFGLPGEPWVGAQSMVRNMTLHDDGSMSFAPISAFDALVAPPQSASFNATPSAPAAVGSASAQQRVTATFDASLSTLPSEFGLTLAGANLTFAVASTSTLVTLGNQKLLLDTLQPSKAGTLSIDVDIWVDGPVVEAFVLGGRSVLVDMTATGSPATLAVWAGAGARVEGALSWAAVRPASMACDPGPWCGA